MTNLTTGNVCYLGRSARERLTGQRACAVWLYGLSGSGKSTLACALEHALHAEGRLTTILDGDQLRTGLNRGLGFSDDDRRENLRRAAEVARLMVHTGIITICAFITPARAFRSMARQIIGEEDFVEVYVRAPIEVCRQRDVKGLYARADGGGIKHFTGRDSAFEEPEHADVVIDTAQETREDSVARLLAHVKARISREGD